MQRGIRMDQSEEKSGFYVSLFFWWSECFGNTGYCDSTNLEVSDIFNSSLRQGCFSYFFLQNLGRTLSSRRCWLTLDRCSAIRWSIWLTLDWARSAKLSFGKNVRQERAAGTVLGMLWDSHLRICFYSKANLSLISFAWTTWYFIKFPSYYYYMFQAAPSFSNLQWFPQQGRPFGPEFPLLFGESRGSRSTNH